MRRLALQIAIQAIKSQIDHVYWSDMPGFDHLGKAANALQVKEHLHEIQADLEVSLQELILAEGFEEALPVVMPKDTPMSHNEHIAAQEVKVLFSDDPQVQAIIDRLRAEDDARVKKLLEDARRYTNHLPIDDIPF